MPSKFKSPGSMALFDESIKSKYTKMNYHSHLRHLNKFMNIKSASQLSAIRTEQLQNALENYLMELKRTANPNSIPTMFQGIRHFCIMNRIPIDWDIIHKMFPHKQNKQILRSYTTSEIRSMLSYTTSSRDRALIHFLASTGARIGIFDHDLLMKHMHKMPKGCYAVKLYAGENEEYWSFLTPQASESVDRYHAIRKKAGERFDVTTPIFTSRGLAARQLSWNGARSAMYRVLQASGVIRHKHASRYNVQINHGFRKRFNTILKMNNSVNYSAAEKLMGHKTGLDGTYFTPSVDDLFAEFQKAIDKIEI